MTSAGTPVVSEIDKHEELIGIPPYFSEEDSESIDVPHLVRPIT